MNYGDNVGSNGYVPFNPWERCSAGDDDSVDVANFQTAQELTSELSHCRHRQAYLSRTGPSVPGPGLLRQNMIILNSIDSGVLA